MSENIESTLQENRLFEPSEAFQRNARIKAADLEAMHRKAETDHEGFWADLAREEIDWKQPFTTVLDACWSGRRATWPRRVR